MKKQTRSSSKTPDPEVKLTIDGELTVLWTTSTLFKKLKQKTVFRFYSEISGLLTLHGWESDDDTFGDYDEPTIKLNMGKQKYYRFGNKTYFGNLVLRRDEIKKIKRKIGNSFNYVVFIPFDPFDAEQEPGHITYDIQLTNANPNESFPIVAVPTNVGLNPSPPRNSR